MLAQAGGLDGGGHVKHVVAFRNHHIVKEDVTAGDAVIDLRRAGRMVKCVLAGLECFSAVKVMPEQKRILAADDARVLQISRNMAGRRTGLELHQLLQIWTRRQQERIRQKTGEGKNCDENESEKELEHEFNE